MTAPAARRSAAERREEIVAIALRHFALGGYHGTSTEAIAREAGISQPYLFRLFGTKRQLFMACCLLAQRTVKGTWESVARGLPREERLAAMGSAYADLLEDEHMLRFMLQMQAACSDAEIRAHVRAGYVELIDLVRQLTGAPEPEVWTFFAHGMLLNMVASIDMRAIAGEVEWAAAWCAPKSLIDPTD